MLCILLSLACNVLQPTIPTSTPILQRPTSTSLPATLPPEPSPVPTEETVTNFPSRIVYSLFSRGEGVFIHTVDANGENDIRLTENDCVAALPAWSPDGSLIAYYCYDSQKQKASLWVMKQDGSEARFVSDMPDLLPYQWSHDNSKIVFYAPQADGTENDIYVLELTNGEIVNITEGSPVWDAFPSWSPIENVIAFVSDRSGDGKSLDDVWTMNADGSNLVNLTNNGENWEDDYPSWSPDGSLIAFFRSSIFGADEGGPAGLWVMDADGGNQRLVTAIDGFRASDAAKWSPDGSYLAYPFKLGEVEEVWVVPSKGGEPVNVSNLPGRKGSISWSPDSNALIFTNNNDDQNTLKIYIALPDGADTHPLLSGERDGFGDWAP